MSQSDVQPLLEEMPAAFVDQSPQQSDLPTAPPLQEHPPNPPPSYQPQPPPLGGYPPPPMMTQPQPATRFQSTNVTVVQQAAPTFCGFGYRPVIMTCPSCNNHISTRVSYKAGSYAWLMVLLLVLIGLVLGIFLL